MHKNLHKEETAGFLHITSFFILIIYSLPAKLLGYVFVNHSVESIHPNNLQTNLK